METELTHGGRALAEIEDGDESDGSFGGGDGYERPDKFGFGGADFVRAAHFGGGKEGEAGRELTQREALDMRRTRHPDTILQ